MSLSLSLIKYKMTNDGKYLEEGLHVIKSCFLSENTNSNIRKKNNYAELILFEDENSSETSTLDCILESNLDNVIEVISNMFIDYFLKIKNIPEDEIKLNLQKTIEKIGEIANIYNLLALKKNEYLDDKSVIVKIG